MEQCRSLDSCKYMGAYLPKMHCFDYEGPYIALLLLVFFLFQVWQRKQAKGSYKLKPLNACLGRRESCNLYLGIEFSGVCRAFLDFFLDELDEGAAVIYRSIAVSMICRGSCMASKRESLQQL